MTISRAALFALAASALFAGDVRAQFPDPPPVGTFSNQRQSSPFPNPPAAGQPMSVPPPSQSPFPNPPGMTAAPPAGPPQDCAAFIPLREDAEKKGNAIGAAIKRKATPVEACSLLRTFETSEARMIKWIADNSSRCGVPPQVLPQLRDNQKKTIQARTNACQAASAGPRPTAPRQTLGDALGVTRIPDASTTRTGRGGAFDTLSGNPIGR